MGRTYKRKVKGPQQNTNVKRVWGNRNKATLDVLAKSGATKRKGLIIIKGIILTKPPDQKKWGGISRCNASPNNKKRLYELLRGRKKNWEGTFPEHQRHAPYPLPMSWVERGVRSSDQPGNRGLKGGRERYG